MCLYVKNLVEVKIAEEDIVCYKVLKREEVEHWLYKKTTFVTPYTIFPVKIGKEYKVRYPKYFPSISNNEINGNAFHSFVEKKAAEREFDYWMKCNIPFCHEYKFVVVQCVIPKGSKYVEGSFERENCYASEKLKYVKILTYSHE